MEKKAKQQRHHMGKILWRQIKLIKEEKKSYLYIVFIINMICSGVLPIIAVILPKLLIDALTEQQITKVYQYIGILVSISFILSVIIVTCKLVKDGRFLELRMNQFSNYHEKYLKIDYPFMEDATFQDRRDNALQTLSNDNNGFEGTYHILFDILPMFISIILYILIIGTLHWSLIVICILGSVVSMFITIFAGKYAYQKKEELARTRRQTKYYYETCYDFSYGKDIRIYQLIDKLKQDYQQKSYNYITVFKRIKNREFFLGLLELFMLLVQDGLAYFLVIKAYMIDHTIQLGDMSMYLATIVALSTLLRTCGVKLGALNTETKMTKDFFDFMDDKSYFSQKGKHLALTNTLEIEFKNVSFHYPGSEHFILKNFNFKINQGEKLAIVGTNGAGKTTIIKLICGLFFPTEGDIYVNGVNIKDFDEEAYHKMFSVVFQDYQIYAASVIENVLGNDMGADARKKAIDCISRVGLQEKIESLPLTYDQPLLKVIDEQGVELSGGQSQKLAIARALYKDGNMVILDEPTAALDALAEAEIYQNFDALVSHKTAIYISHRLSSTKFCDHIALFTKDGLAEYGTHDELMALQKEYYQMFTIQGKYYQKAEAYE